VNETRPEPETLVRYRLDRARETLEEARLLADGRRWNGCVNRLYYASFYAVSAALLARGLSSTRHTGVRALFNAHLVKTGEVSTAVGELYNDLFRDRQEGDYTDLAAFSEAEVRPQISAVASLVAQMTDLSGLPPED